MSHHRARGLPVESGSGEREDHLLLAVIVLGVVAAVLVLVVIYGYCKFVRGRRSGDRDEMEGGGRERSGNMREGEEGPSPASGGEDPPLGSQLAVPVKMRKRSMTFTETDEECRKYREDLAESFDSKAEPGEGSDRFRKKSVVTFAGVEEIDANGL